MDVKHRQKGMFGRYKGAVLAAVLFVVHLVLIRIAGVVPSHRLLFLFFFFSVILVPGYFLSRFVVPIIALPGRALLSFVFGTAALFTVLMVFSIFRLDLFYLGAAMPALSMVLAAMPRPGTQPVEPGPVTVTKGAQAILLLLLAFVSLLIVSRGDPMLYTSDSAGQIAYIRTVSRTHEAFPGQNLYRDGGKLTRDIRKGLMHSAMGTVNMLTGRNDVFTVWPLIAGISSVFTILALFCAGWLVFRSPVIGLLAGFIFVFIYGYGLTSYRLITAAYSFQLGRPFSITFLIAILGYIGSGRRDLLILMSAAAFAATGTHIGHLLVCAFIILFTAGGKLIESRGNERADLLVRLLPAAAIVTAGVNIPYLLMRYIRDYAPNNTIHTHLQGTFRLTGNLYTLNPLVYYRQSGVLVVLGLLSIFLLWRHSREDENLRLLLWGNITLWLLLFNPLLFPPLMKAIAYLVMRLKIAVPVSLLSAVLVKVLWDRAWGRRTGMSTWSAAAGWTAVIVFFGYQLAVTPKDFAYGRQSDRESRASCLNISDIYEQIEMHVPDGEVIASDPVTSYCIPAFSDQFIICTNSQHSVPNDSTALERISDCRAIFSPLSSLHDMAQVLAKYESRFIVVNGRIPLSTGTMYWKLDRAMAREAFERLESHPMYFENIYSENDVALFRIKDEFMSAYLPDGEGAFTEAHVGDAVSVDDLSGMTPSGISGIRIKEVRPAAPSAARGGKLEIEIDWVLEEPVDYRGFVVHVRFDTDFEKGGLYRESYGKLYRKGLEKREGRRYRFRVDHLPFNGIVTPDLWPPLRVVRDRVVVSVPRDVAAGEYVISIRMAEATHYPNFSLTDLLSDDDSFNGPDMSSILIE